LSAILAQMPDDTGINDPVEMDDDDRERLEAQRERMEQIRLRASADGFDDQNIVDQLTGFEDVWTKRLTKARQYLRRSRVPTLRPLLPLLLQLKGKPYTLQDYFPFEPFFRTRMAKRTVLKTARQVSKSTSLAARGVIFANSIPYFSTLYVTPLFEMIRRFSHNYVRQFIETSPAKRLFLGSNSLNSVLQRNFRNGSTMYFSYAFLDAERTRGIPGDCLVTDESQDLNREFLPIMIESLSGSPWGIMQHAGTPKSLDNTMEWLWQDSSQAEWAVKCRTAGCGHWNIPSLEWDLYEMIGPYHDDIGPKRAGVTCAKCMKPLDPRRDGRWTHRYRDRRWDFAGYHVPQQVMPMHYGNRAKWGKLLRKQQGEGSITTTTFLNEVCGESSDHGSKLVTLSDIREAACLPLRPKLLEAIKFSQRRYKHKILAVDWGGGGGKLSNSKKTKSGEEQRLRTSFTTLAALGMRPDGRIEVFWGHRSLRTHDYLYEAQLCITAMSKLKLTHLAHDYSGAGEGRMVVINQAGVPMSNIINISYHGVGSNIMVPHAADDDNPNTWYSLDRSYSLVTTCMCIKNKLITTFQDDYQSADSPGLLRDFLSLIEEKTERKSRMDLFTITKSPTGSDDFAHAVNYGASALFWMTGKWPDIAAAARFKIPQAEMKHIHPQEKVDWDDMSL
jgi:hypothetical protein